MQLITCLALPTEPLLDVAMVDSDEAAWGTDGDRLEKGSRSPSFGGPRTGIKAVL